MSEDFESRDLEPGRARFGLRALLLIMLVCSIAAAGGSYLMQALRGGTRGAQLVFLLFSLAGPVVLLLLLSLPARLAEWRRPRNPPLRAAPRPHDPSRPASSGPADSP